MLALQYLTASSPLHFGKFSAIPPPLFLCPSSPILQVLTFVHNSFTMNYDWSLNASGGQPLGPSPQPPHQITPQNLYQTLRQLGTLGAHFVFEAEHHGNRHWLFVFSRLNGSKIVVRVQKQYQVPVHPEIVQNMVRREVYVLKKLEQIRFLYAPICLAFDISYSNPIRFPFLVLTWTEGERLIWTNHHPTLDLRIRVMNQLSRLQLELIDNSLESRAETAKYFYTRHIHDNMMVAPRGLPGAGGIPTQEDYWNQLSHLECILGSGHGDKTYAIAHNNITYENIIVDKDCNVECIVGWSHAGVRS
ncbi:hypothetical protein LMH87_001804 [Akanthomyces muscarius]|uniref:Protein kinase domain-containing protein n=1 Tax=Akanthomyces muscarius TaxID=2231603 RepID=A0A9W8Q5K4_AKAMU|nr:hypothetical protein LMH87_001804 [Akanthomyces muscarius]KAJ4147268.1 hypothetical protein LMH87_001804 [Akanthomyces muscarius]